jgi:hypothetical protein
MRRNHTVTPFMPAVPSASAPAGLPCSAGEVDEFIGRPSAEAAAVLARTTGPVLVLGAGGKLGLHLSIMLQRVLADLGRPTDLTAVSRFQSLHDTAEFARHGIATRALDLCDPPPSPPCPTPPPFSSSPA